MPDPRIWPIVKSVISQELVGVASTLVMEANRNRADADFIVDDD